MDERLITDLSTLSTKELAEHNLSPLEAAEEARRFRWRIHLSPCTEPDHGFDLELNRDLTLGIADAQDVVDLKPYSGMELGVSRRHLRLLPSETDLIAIDQGSTNGTRLNKRILQKHMPYKLADGDTLSLGKLELTLKIVSHPGDSDADLRAQADLAEVLAQMAKAVTSQLDRDQILDHALEMARSLTLAGDVSVWLLDEETEELYLEAEQGIEDERMRRVRIPVRSPLLAQVMQDRRPFRARGSDSGELIKVKTDYMVQALLLVPLVHQQLVFGVLAASHRNSEKAFSQRDERLLESLGDFVAIALQNARLYEQVQEADRLKGEMIQNVSHEFRTPLTYIMGYLELLLESPDPLTTEQQESLQIALKQSQRLNWLVENFVALDSVKHIVSRRGCVPISELLEDAVASAQVTASGRSIELNVEMDPDLPPALINRMAVLQVLDNLISNALKFTPEQGCVTLRASWRAEDKKLVLSVSDTGIGIPPDLRDRVFDRFFQVDGSSRRRYGGVGIGLAVCKAIIEAHGESIWIDSPPEGGAVFSFTLPVTPYEALPDCSLHAPD